MFWIKHLIILWEQQFKKMQLFFAQEFQKLEKQLL